MAGGAILLRRRISEVCILRRSSSFSDPANASLGTGYENAFHIHRVSSSVHLPTRWSESDYRRYDLPSTNSAPSSRALSRTLSSSVQSQHETSTNTQSPAGRASSAASTRSYVSAMTPHAEPANLPILPPMRTTSSVPSLTLQRPSPARVQLPSLHSSLEREHTP